jgi:hypothetical protein
VFGTVTSSNGPGDATSATTTITIDRTTPTLNSVAAPANGNYYPAQNLNFTAAFSEAVVVSGTPRLTLTIGSTTRPLFRRGTYAPSLPCTISSNPAFRSSISWAITISVTTGTSRRNSRSR